MSRQKEDNILNYSRLLWETYSSYRITDFPGRNFHPDVFYGILSKKRNLLPAQSQISVAGKSFEGREIYRIQCGTGPANVLLWSQMHGDEPTATMAICDILNYLSREEKKRELINMLSLLTLHFVPLVNPDGAMRFQRRNAQQLDINRDALALRTPEGNILKKLQSDLKPEFGFNLHDQELSTVGNTGVISAMSLLAPAFDEERSENPIRKRAKKLVALFNSVLQLFIPGKVTKYDDSYEPRAFGDNLQKCGTSTLLIESGHTENDPQKETIRKLNFVGILSALNSIASDQYESSGTAEYEKLPLTGKRAYDLIIRNVLIDHNGKEKTAADLAVSYQVDTHSESPPMLVDVGDLHTYVGLNEINANAKTVASAELKLNKAFNWEKYF